VSSCYAVQVFNDRNQPLLYRLQVRYYSDTPAEDHESKLIPLFHNDLTKLRDDIDRLLEKKNNASNTPADLKEKEAQSPQNAAEACRHD